MLPAPFPGAVYLGSGRTRAAWARNARYVVKIPLCEMGQGSNYHEAAISRRYGTAPDIDGICYARCRIMKNGWLVMERVTPLHPAHAPGWAGLVDCGQVGVTSSGRIVAYDYGF